MDKSLDMGTKYTGQKPGPNARTFSDDVRRGTSQLDLGNFFNEKGER
jgi:hypothetical protein